MTGREVDRGPLLRIRAVQVLSRRRHGATGSLTRSGGNQGVSLQQVTAAVVTAAMIGQLVGDCRL